MCVSLPACSVSLLKFGISLNSNDRIVYAKMCAPVMGGDCILFFSWLSLFSKVTAEDTSGIAQCDLLFIWSQITRNKYDPKVLRFLWEKMLTATSLRLDALVIS